MHSGFMYLGRIFSSNGVAIEAFFKTRRTSPYSLLRTSGSGRRVPWFMQVAAAVIFFQIFLRVLGVVFTKIEQAPGGLPSPAQLLKAFGLFGCDRTNICRPAELRRRNCACACGRKGRCLKIDADANLEVEFDGSRNGEQQKRTEWERRVQRSR
jgi:hypothetical protein